MPTTYRVLVSTDLGGDPDDIQSLYRLLHYSDILRLEGIGSCCGPGSANSARLILEWIKRIDIEAIRRNGHPELMSERALLNRVRQGATTPGPPGATGTTPASRQIIEQALADDPDGSGRPLWVLVWGSITDLAQALHDEPAIAGRIRINYIGSSNTEADPASRDWVYRFMVERHPELWWIEDGMLPKLSHDTFRGCYQGGDQSDPWGNKSFIDRVIRGKGTTHEGLFDQRCGDAFPVAGWPAGSLKEGDTPTFLYLLSPVIGAVGNVDDPTAESWGGQFRRPDPQRFPNYSTDLDADAETCQQTIARWRQAHLSDWRQRWQRYPEQR